jgi:peptide/nickel transport system substrate-binding protein
MNKKLFFVLLAIVLIVLPLLVSCKTTTTTSPTTTITSSKTTTTTITTTSTPAVGQPVSGGILKIGFSMFPSVIAYPPELSETIYRPFWMEPLMFLDSQNNMNPALATDVTTDLQNKTITWTLRQGVKFHDGTDWNAAAARANFLLLQNNGVLPYQDKVTSIEAIDNYTFRISLSELTYIVVQTYSTQIYMVSVTAIEKNGVEWARLNGYGTGPFKLASFERDNYIIFEKNTNYWRTGRPYLDRIEIRIYLDDNIRSAALESKEIDYSKIPNNTVDFPRYKDLGLKIIAETIVPSLLFIAPDSANPNSPLANQLIREACEYAIDKEGLATGYYLGAQIPAYQATGSGLGYDSNYAGRKYDTAKARQLIAQAGFSNGVDVGNINGVTRDTQLYAAVQSMWKEVGITSNIVTYDWAKYDIAQKEGWSGWFFNRIANPGSPSYIPGFLDTFGPPPVLNPMGSFAMSDAYLALCEQLKSASDSVTANTVLSNMIKQLTTEAAILPLTTRSENSPYWPYLHFENAMARGAIDWAEVWSEK